MQPSIRPSQTPIEDTSKAAKRAPSFTISFKVCCSLTASKVVLELFFRVGKKPYPKVPKTAHFVEKVTLSHCAIS